MGARAIVDGIKQWVETHAPTYPWSGTRWQSRTPEVRKTALDLTHQRIESLEQEIRETTKALQAEVDVLRESHDEHAA